MQKCSSIILLLLSSNLFCMMNRNEEDLKLYTHSPQAQEHLNAIIHIKKTFNNYADLYLDAQLLLDDEDKFHFDRGTKRGIIIGCFYDLPICLITPWGTTDLCHMPITYGNQQEYTIVQSNLLANLEVDEVKDRAKNTYNSQKNWFSKLYYVEQFNDHLLPTPEEDHYFTINGQNFFRENKPIFPYKKH